MRNAGYAGYQLRELKKRGVIASVFTDPENPDDFIAGYVAAVNARTAMLRSITPYGRGDGYFAVRLSAVNEVIFDSAYAERLELLMRLGDAVEAGAEFSDEPDHVEELLLNSAKNRRVVTVWTTSEAFTGIARDVNDLHTSLDTLDFMGNLFPPILLKLTDIELISLGSEEERMFETLVRYHENGGRMF